MEVKEMEYKRKNGGWREEEEERGKGCDSLERTRTWQP